MTNDADFKRVVRDRMAATGESYTRALSAVTANTVARIDKLLTQAREHGGDRLDREPMLIEAANLICGLDGRSLDAATMRRLLRFCPPERRLALLDAFLERDGLDPHDEGWARLQRLIRLSHPTTNRSAAEATRMIAAQLEYDTWVRAHLPAEEWGQMLTNPTITSAWHNAGRQDELERLMATRLEEIPHTPKGRTDRLGLARELMWSSYRKGDTAAGDRFMSVMRDIISAAPPLADAVVWENVVRQTPLVAMPHLDVEQRRRAAEEYAAWIRALDPPDPLWMGEAAVLCMFNGMYEDGERYAVEALEAGAGRRNPLIYMWRAGCHLGATGDVLSTAGLVADARRHLPESEVLRLLRDQSPFSDYPNDPTMLAAASHRTAS